MRELQEWMLGAIASAEAPSREEVLARLTEEERIHLYRGMYDARMVETLTNDYPAIAAFLGEHDFAHLVADYIAVYPSQSYTLNRLGDRFPEFVGTSAHGDDRAFLRDLARLELAMTQVFDEAETPLLDPGAIASITPESRMPLIAALRLLEFDYPVNDLFQAFRDEETLSVPEPQRTWLAVHRRDYSVIRMPLEEKAFGFLTMLKNGATLGEACDAIIPEQEELFAWFRDWSAAGLFGEPI